MEGGDLPRCLCHHGLAGALAEGAASGTAVAAVVPVSPPGLLTRNFT